jgi:hypothetical protein
VGCVVCWVGFGVVQGVWARVRVPAWAGEGLKVCVGVWVVLCVG